MIRGLKGLRRRVENGLLTRSRKETIPYNYKLQPLQKFLIFLKLRFLSFIIPDSRFTGEDFSSSRLMEYTLVTIHKTRFQ